MEKELELELENTIDKLNENPLHEQYGTAETWEIGDVLYLLKQLLTYCILPEKSEGLTGFSAVGLSMAIADVDFYPHISIAQNLIILSGVIKHNLDSVVTSY